MDVVVGGGIHSLRAGQVFVTRPNEVHAGVGGVLQQCEFYWAQVDSDHLTTELDKLLSECAERRHFQVRPRASALMKEILDEHAEADPLSSASARSLTELLILELARASAPGFRTLSEPVQKCVDFFRSDLASPTKFLGIAREIGVSTSFLAKHFHDEIGESPAKWFLHERLDVASKMLLEGASTRKIAKCLGYSSAQNFATTFLRELGMTPSEYRRYLTSLADGHALPSDAPLLD